MNEDGLLLSYSSPIRNSRFTRTSFPSSFENLSTTTSLLNDIYFSSLHGMQFTFSPSSPRNEYVVRFPVMIQNRADSSSYSFLNHQKHIVVAQQLQLYSSHL